MPRVLGGTSLNTVFHTSAFSAAETQSRCAWLSSRGVTMLDIDAETWLKPWRLLKQMHIRRVLLPYRSPSAKDTRLRKLKRSPFSNISGNGVRLNGITTRGNEGFLAISRRFIFPSRDATGRLGYSASKKRRRRYGYSDMRRHLIKRTTFCE
jgi:hypothetical protein